MIDVEELSKRLVYYRATNKISITQLAKQLKISVNTLQKVIRKKHVKEITRIYIWEKMDNIEKEENNYGRTRKKSSCCANTN